MNTSKTTDTYDRFYLGEGAVYPVSPDISGINGNVAAVGGTGSGKSFSIALPLILHNLERSMVIPLGKRELINKCSDVLLSHGYDVQIMDLTDGEMATVGYNPVKYLKNDHDCIEFAERIVKTTACTSDPFWTNAGRDVIAALLYLTILNSREAGRQATWSDFIELYKILKITKVNSDITSTTLDCLFDKAERKYPGNFASRAWKTLSGNPIRTASCIYTTVNGALSKYLSESIIKSSEMDIFDFGTLGEKKTALFILTSSFDMAIKDYIDVIYSSMLRDLMAKADKSETEQLDIPVQIIFDDFACGSKIEEFEKYISIFRAAGISAVLLLQSESQLAAIYGQFSSTTILNNCDTYIYLGGNDYQTCQNIAYKTGKQVRSILNMELENVVIMRRGSEPVFTTRYKVLEDPEYKNMIRMMEQKRKVRNSEER